MALSGLLHLFDSRTAAESDGNNFLMQATPRLLLGLTVRLLPGCRIATASASHRRVDPQRR